MRKSRTINHRENIRKQTKEGKTQRKINRKEKKANINECAMTEKQRKHEI